MDFYSDNIAYLDGTYLLAGDANGSLLSQSLHYGIGAFEGIRAYETKNGPRFFKLKEHFQRLCSSAEAACLRFNMEFEGFQKICDELLKQNNLTQAYARPLIFTAPNMRLTVEDETHFFIGIWEWGKFFGDKALDLTFSNFKLPDPEAFYIHAKICGQYVNSVMATTAARQKGFDEGIQLDSQGFVGQAAGANIFFEKEEIIYTPKADCIFPGITRNTIIQLLSEIGIEVIERNILPEELLEADSVFLTGTATEVSPVGSIEGQQMKVKWEDSIGYLISRKYKKLVTQEEGSLSTLI